MRRRVTHDQPDRQRHLPQFAQFRRGLLIDRDHAYALETGGQALLDVPDFVIGIPMFLLFGFVRVQNRKKERPTSRNEKASSGASHFEVRCVKLSAL